MPGVLGTVKGTVVLDIRNAVAGYAALRAQNAKLVYALRGTSESFISSGRSMVTAGAGLVYIFGKAVNAAAEFQRRMDFFGAITNANAREMDRLRKFTLKMGTDTIYTVDEIADGFIELGKAGISAQDIMDGIGRAMANLGAAADIPLAESGQIITSTLTTWGLEATKATYVVNELQGAANATIADVSDLGVSIKYVGGIAATTGVSLSDTIDAISVLAQAGIRGSTAGTSLRQMLVSLPGATGPAVETMKELGIITKNNNNLFYDQTGTLKPLPQVFQILQNHMEGLNNKQKIMALRTIFNNRALAAASILTRAGAKGFERMHKAVGKTTAEEIMHKRLDNLSGDIKILKANIQTMLVSAGSPFQEQMRSWVQQLTKLIQAFGKLDPKTQKMIVQTIGMAGAALIAMGIFNLLVGTMLRFIANMIKMGAGIKFLVKIIQILVVNLRWLIVLFGGELAAALGISLGALLAIVAIIVAVIAVLVILYKKWTPFRNLVNAFASAVWDAIKAVAAFLKLLATDPGAAWDKLKSLAGQVASAIGRAFSHIASEIGNALQGTLESVGQFIRGVAIWFALLPGRVLGLLSRFVSKVISLLTFRNLGFVIGYVIGTVIRLWFTFYSRLVSLTAEIVSGVLRFFATLPGRIGYFIGFLIGRAIRLWLTFMQRSFAIIGRLVQGVIRFFARLPGRVIAFVVRTATGAAHALARAAQALPGLAQRAVEGIINFFQQLPGRVAHFFTSMVSQSINLMHRMQSRAEWFAAGIFQGFISGIQGLPQAVWGILQDVIGTIRSVITAGFNAVRDFAAGLWAGFRKGLGINSPSLIEKQMWQITGVVDEETKKLAKQTMKVQKLSRDMADTQFGVGMNGSSRAQDLRRLASMHARNRDRARMIPSNFRRRRAIGDARRGRTEKRRELVITNWHQGRGYMREIADDAVDDNSSFDDFVGSGGY